MTLRPRHLDLQRDHGLTIEWGDGSRSFYPVIYLRKKSPSADNRSLQRELDSNPLAVLPASMVGTGPLRAESAELIGQYAIKITFSDGHDTGIYSWSYLREIDPGEAPDEGDPT